MMMMMMIVMMREEVLKTNKIKVNVTAEDIKKGVRGSDICCPIALALNREVKSTPETQISVNYGFLSVQGTGKLIMHSETLPCEARLFIRDFDAGNDVKPFSFSVSLKNLKIKVPH